VRMSAVRAAADRLTHRDSDRSLAIVSSVESLPTASLS
jgi:hypothetical protein